MAFPDSSVVAIAMHAGRIPDSRAQCQGKPMLIHPGECSQALLHAIRLAGWAVMPPLLGRAGALGSGVESGAPEVAQRLREVQDAPYEFAGLAWHEFEGFSPGKVMRSNAMLSEAAHLLASAQKVLTEMLALARLVKSTSLFGGVEQATYLPDIERFAEMEAAFGWELGRQPGRGGLFGPEMQSGQDFLGRSSAGLQGWSVGREVGLSISEDLVKALAALKDGSRGIGAMRTVDRSFQRAVQAIGLQNVTVALQQLQIAGDMVEVWL
jgi:hypothetical protein